MMRTFQTLTLIVLTVVLVVLHVGSTDAATIAPYTPDGNTAVLYHMDETTGTTADDASANMFDLSGSSVSASSGPSGLSTAADFTSAHFTRSLTLGELGNFDLQTFTIEGWVKFDPDTNPAGPGMFQIRQSGQTRVSVRFDNDRINLATEGSGGFNIINSGNLVWDPNLWYHVAVTYDGDGAGDDSVVKFYRTPETDTSGSATQVGSTQTGRPDINAFTAGTSLYVGTLDNSSGARLTGLADEVRYYNAVLEANEFNLSEAAAVIPEPSSLMLLGLGALGLMRTARRRRWRA